MLISTKGGFFSESAKKRIALSEKKPPLDENVLGLANLIVVE